MFRASTSLFQLLLVAQDIRLSLFLGIIGLGLTWDGSRL
jgi:hypothetical protein